MKRTVLGAVVIALAVGAAIGALAFSTSGTKSASAGQIPSDLRVVSTWNSKPHKGEPVTRLQSGSLQGDPGHGFVLVEVDGEKPVFFSAPAGTGAFRLVQASATDGWVFRAGDGSLLLVSGGYPAIGTYPDFTYLGRPLDPAHLGTIGANGVAIPVSYGAWSMKKQQAAHTAVVLVERSNRWPTWQLAGYLPGYSIPAATHRLQELSRPLIGPDGRAYTIDAKRGRLVPATGWHGSTSPVAPRHLVHYGNCSAWPAPDHGTYQACPNTISLQRPGSSAVTLMQRHLGKNEVPQRAWTFAQASPDGKWLLLEDNIAACGIGRWADFLPSGGGELQSAFAEANTSEALGWLPDSTALVAVQTSECDGGPVGGIYQVRPGGWPGPAPTLVFATQSFDATTWGFGS